MNGRRMILGLASVTAVAASFAAGTWWGDHAARRSDQWGPERLISTAIDSVRANALDALPSEELLRRAVSGMLRELRDPYAALLRPEGAASFRSLLKGDGKGQGMIVRRTGKQLTVVRVFPGSPAAAADVRAGDKVVSVNGLLVSNQTERAPGDQFSDLAKAGTDSSNVVLYRPLLGDTLRVSFTSAGWHAPAASDVVMLSRNIGYVALTTVSAKASDELDDALHHLVDLGAKSVVLDLRGNGGGLLEEGVRIASLFLPRNALVVSVTGKAGTPPTERRTSRNGRWATLPVAVLVDARTASAAEIVAAALRDHNRALLVGEPSYGKGLVQRVVALTPELSMRMTTARWATPSGQVLERRHGIGIDATGGLMPDVFVPDAARRDAIAAPAGMSEPASARLLRLADTAAARALRERWSTATLSLLESQLHMAIDTYLAPSPGNPTRRAVLVGEATRLATVRVLEVTGKTELALRYHAGADHALRAALDVLAPGEQPLQVEAAPVARARVKAPDGVAEAPKPAVKTVAPSDSGRY